MRKSLQHCILLFICLINSLLLLASDPVEGTSTLKGRVTTSDKNPAAFVTVQVIEVNKTVVTNEEGYFTIKNLAGGTYKLKVSLVGYQTITKTVSVGNNETAEISIELAVSQKQLEEVKVISGRNKFFRPGSPYVSRLPLRNVENPQVYNTITRELLQEQVITNFDDAVKNAPGIDKLWTSTGRSGDGAAYFSLRGFSVQPSMINGVAGLTNGGLDPANMERIEVIKGPSGTLFGSSLVSFGGLINIVTKKPYDSAGGEIAYTAGSYGLNRITVDYNTPLNKSKNTLLRFNGSYHNENSFQDAGFRKTFFVAPSLSHRVNDKLFFLINAEYFHSEQTNPLMVFLNRSRKLVATNIDELQFDFNRSYTSNDITIKNPTLNLYGQAEYKLSDKWTSQTSFSRSNRRSDGYYSYIMYILPGDSLLNRYVSDQNAVSVSSNFQQNFIGDFRIGSLRNRLVAGVDVFYTESNNSNSAYIFFDTLNSLHADPKYTQLTTAALEARFAQNNNPTKTSLSSYTYSAYASDVLNITDRLLAMASLRIDRFDNKGTYNMHTNQTAGAFEQTALSPKFGAVYQVVKNRVSLFANYMNGFRNVSAVTQPDGTVSNFKPQQANQWEGGIKMDLFGGWLNGSISYYDIYVQDITRPHPDKVGYTVQDGNLSSKGLEIDLIANPLPGLNIIAGYSYNESKNEKTDPASVGRRPVSAGPRNLANTWISYNVLRGALKGFGIGFGGNYASENIITNTATTGQFILPSYTVLNTSLFYNTPSYHIGVKLDNLTDKQYFKGWTTIEPQLPRRISAQLSFKF